MYIFIGVLLYGFVYHWINFPNYWYDQSVWENQIQYFMNHDPRGIDFYGAYGHPGTTLVGLGSLFHILFGASYHNALRASMSLLIAVSTAACTVICYLLYQRSLWWITTAFILTSTRLYTTATPPTATVMPFIALIVIAAWWLGEQQALASRWFYFTWGVIVGLSAATRLDATLMVSAPMFILAWYRSGHRVVLPVFAGTAISFFIADPYLWFMPVQHVTDLANKFTLHHGPNMRPMAIHLYEAFHVPLAVISIIWSLVIVAFRGRTRIIPPQIIVVFLGTSLIAAFIVFSSTFQAIRYFFPFIIVWEIFLPLFALETFAPSGNFTPAGSLLKDNVGSWIIIGFVILYVAAH